ncbi:MAG TPA: tRNA (adenosine(37)-N6)-threonylcarbamoyltransferase complex ATPase subunit type 1 TsaE [Niabella sp.]|jgi:tRNA threonylcarbamoyladenosine biosynthesis protein TsaE|nr:tRNA (adenosine(37)-N6)-threonylcarbamoyltransferase complex ATPase subunit type 1 TsaE [Chitinophagaceae bacterium]HRN47482.1 tRNA (adenosine(37)-N6)-threonylcarbamoyltransferase complex ATPase subunit type 1 TsaE [Niabella sp.]HRO84007.1 tRNA (adenosine(37)-N6)-threonylcarbamoyltransferase complex ATPase subunit type 1 TsaE [Niabella sp.]HUN04718.1 tRNA (adenosine(37)-N6)-threonylcarbamoyltransferase complex ATPase subunit type 1 TsaE [Niabella sp.]
MQKIYDKNELAEVAEWLWQQLNSNKILALHGEMGSGKTTLVHTICDYLGVKDTVGSPTFSIINEYSFQAEGKEQPIFHIDLYRLKDEEEAVRTGVEDTLYSGSYCFVEWPEVAPEIFPDDTLHVFISLAGNEKRKIEIERK